MNIIVWIYRFSIIAWVIDLVKDVKMFLKFRNATFESESFLNENNLRVDLLGRIYTVINLKDETIESGNEVIQEGDVYQSIVEYSDVLMKVGLSHYCYPKLRKIDDNEGVTVAYLVFLYPLYNSVDFFYFLFALLHTLVIYILMKLFIEFNLNDVVWNYLDQALRILF